MEDKEQDYIAKRLTYDKNTLELYLYRYESYIQSRNLWQIFLSLFITFLVSYFANNPTGTISGTKTDYDQFLLIGLAIFAVLFLITSILAACKSNPVKKLEEELHKNYINKPDKNALFIIKRNIDNEDQILVYKEKAWGDAYFLPYVRVKIKDSKITIKEKIADILNYQSSEIDIKNLLDELQITEKYHPRDNVVREYHSSYYHLSANQSLSGRDISINDTFIVGAKNFEWKTQADIEKSQRTQDKNGDILDMLRKNKSTFITNSSTFS